MTSLIRRLLVDFTRVGLGFGLGFGRSVGLGLTTLISHQPKITPTSNEPIARTPLAALRLPSRPVVMLRHGEFAISNLTILGDYRTRRYWLVGLDG